MPLDAPFAPYRLAPGAPPEEVVRAAEALAAEPLVAPPLEPIPAAPPGALQGSTPAQAQPQPTAAAPAPGQQPH